MYELITQSEADRIIQILNETRLKEYINILKPINMEE